MVALKRAKIGPRGLCNLRHDESQMTMSKPMTQGLLDRYGNEAVNQVEGHRHAAVVVHKALKHSV